MTRIDTEVCVQLVTGIADRIAREGPIRGDAARMSDQIGQVRGLSRDAGEELREKLGVLHPDVGWVGEEQRLNGGDCWLYDPIDGAYHFLQGLPLWSSSLCLLRAHKPVLSIVYDPICHEIFVATTGQGTTCNGHPVAVSRKDGLRSAVVGTSIPPIAQVGKADQEQAIALISAAAKSVFVIRPMAAVSLQLAYVAAGRLDAFWENGYDMADWLAGSLLVNQSGGVVSTLNGGQLGSGEEGILAANVVQHAALRSVLSPVLGHSDATRSNPPI